MTNHRESLLEDSRKRKGAEVTLSESREQFMTNQRESLLKGLMAPVDVNNSRFVSGTLKHAPCTMEVDNNTEWRCWAVAVLLCLGWACRCQADMFLLASRRYKNRSARVPLIHQ